MININTIHTDSAKEKHWESLKDLLKIRLNSSSLPVYLKKYIKLNLEEIITALPERLIELNNEFLGTVRGRDKKKYAGRLKKIFKYKGYIDEKESKYNAYHLADNLKINTCPYCNRQYTITITGVSNSEKITRPQFDHYFSQEKYPLLAISFYNLIPSCSICNSTIKHIKEFDLSTHIHPYLEDVITKFKFGYTLATMNRCKNIKLKYEICPEKDKIKKTLEDFKLEAIYNGHKFLVDQLLELKTALNDDYLEILTRHSYHGLDSWTPEEAYLYAFGTHYEDDKLYLHPFSKLKKDILKSAAMLSVFDTHK